jgi:hypothetical protein
MASTNLGRLVLIWPLLLTRLMDLQVDGKYRLRNMIGSSMAPHTDWTDGPASTNSERRLVLIWRLLLTRLMDLQVDGKYRLGKKIGSEVAPLTNWTDGPAS